MKPTNTSNNRIPLPVDADYVHAKIEEARRLRAEEMRRIVRWLFRVDIYPKRRPAPVSGTARA